MVNPISEPVYNAAMRLPLKDRIELAERLLMSVDEAELAQREAAWAREAEDRLEAYKRGELTAEPADDLLKALDDGRCP